MKFTPEPKARIIATINDWIAEEAIPFSLSSLKTFDTAVDKIISTMSDSVELLGFGEAIHGGEEILVLRNRLFQRLVEAHGYSAIAIESSFPKGYIANEYVLGQGPAAYEAVQDTGFSHNLGKIEANRELIEWMRQYNADPAHSVKLRFYGFDGPMEMMTTDSPRQLITFVLNYFAAVDAEAAEEHRRRIEPVLGRDADWENPAVAMDPTKSIGQSAEATALRVENESLIAALQIRRPELIEKTNKDNYLEALQYAAEARQLLNYHAEMARPTPQRYGTSLAIRDTIMAENLAYIANREHGRGKVLVFAHNEHLRRGKAKWETHWPTGPSHLTWWPAGAHLSTMFGNGYAVIGSALGVSEANGIGQPEADTLEARLTAIPGPIKLIPTHKGQGLPTKEISALPTRTGSKKNYSYFPLTPQSIRDFDYIAFLETTSYTRGGPPLP